MTREVARELSKQLLAGTSALDWAAGRAPERLGKGYRRVAGQVLGQVYWLLGSVWDEHPELDPRRDDGALEKEGPEQLPTVVTPAAFLELIERLEHDLTNARHLVATRCPPEESRRFESAVLEVARSLEDAKGRLRTAAMKAGVT